MIVIGAGHAGVEAALASARMECSVLLVTFKRETIGLMSCNPSIGGIGKGQLVKEIDALGGQMGKAADACGIQFRVLNSSKGPAVQSSRAQEDRRLYQRYMEDMVLAQKNLFLKETEALSLILENSKIRGVECLEETLYSRTVIIATGTFLNGVIHIGLKEYRAGRINEPTSLKLPLSLKREGLELGRLKTCTTARLDGKTLDFSKMAIQRGEPVTRSFAFSTRTIKLPQRPCFLTYTNKKTHRLIASALKDRRLLHIISQGVNPRYCPSIEEKVIRFPDRARHQIFIEPEGLDTDEYYTNGLFTFLPEGIQADLISTIRGLEHARVTKFGYGIEYDYVYPTQLYPTLETKRIRNLYLAGQINGTTGYEEAAAQGIIAGINAALRVKNKEPFILGREHAYIGVLIDDLVSKGTDEPYRMFTSRCEYRLILREDNADLRLTEFGYKLGLVDKERRERLREKKRSIGEELERIRETKIKPAVKVNSWLKKWRTMPLNKSVTLEELLKRPQIGYNKLGQIDSRTQKISQEIFCQVEIETKYAGYIKRQEEEIRRMQKIKRIKIPPTLDYTRIPGLCREIKEKLARFKPLDLDQALRISGVTPAAISILMVYLRKCSEQNKPVPRIRS